MLPEKHRLKLNQAKSRNWPNKKVIYTPLFKIVFRRKTGGQPPKIGFIVSGKIGKAAVRNKVRRRMSQAMKDKLGQLPEGLEAVVISNNQIKDSSHEEISSFFDKVIPKFNQSNK